MRANPKCTPQQCMTGEEGRRDDLRARHVTILDRCAVYAPSQSRFLVGPPARALRHNISARARLPPLLKLCALQRWCVATHHFELVMPRVCALPFACATLMRLRSRIESADALELGRRVESAYAAHTRPVFFFFFFCVVASIC